MKAHDLAKKLLSMPNYQVIMSRDEEGNGYGTIGEDKSYSSLSILEEKDGEDYGNNQPLIILFPYRERLELDEIPIEK